MTSLFKDIEDCLAHVKDGWCTVAKAQTLAALIISTRPKVVVEVGIFAGRSFIPMAMAAKEIGCEIIGIDPWLPSASAVGQEQADREWWAKLDHEKIYKQFMEDLGKYGLHDTVKVIRAKSDDVDPPNPCSIIHLDGNHSAQAIRDVERFAPNVPVGGFVFADDLQWAGLNVLKAVEILCSKFNFKECYRMDTGALYQRIK